jgi:hypothetical protein
LAKKSGDEHRTGFHVNVNFAVQWKPTDNLCFVLIVRRRLQFVRFLPVAVSIFPEPQAQQASAWGFYLLGAAWEPPLLAHKIGCLPADHQRHRWRHKGNIPVLTGIIGRDHSST